MYQSEKLDRIRIQRRIKIIKFRDLDGRGCSHTIDEEQDPNLDPDFVKMISHIHANSSASTLQETHLRKYQLGWLFFYSANSSASSLDKLVSAETQLSQML
jgi:hypothetical protein